MCADIVRQQKKALSVSPMKTSAPLGGAMAFMGMQGSLPLFHGSQGCTAFALVMMVRHFKEAIPLQTTAMSEVSTILGGMENLEQALVNIRNRAHPKIIGVLTTGLTETRGEDFHGDLRMIRARNPDLDDTAVVIVSTPDFSGGLEDGWAKAVGAMIDSLVPEAAEAPAYDGPAFLNILAGAHLTPGDVDEVREIVEAFGLEAVILPDLSSSLDGHVPEDYIATSLGGTTLDEVARMGSAVGTISIGRHMDLCAEKLATKTGQRVIKLDRLLGLKASDAFVAALSQLSGRPVPAKLRRRRAQLLDAMLDGHFAFQDSAVALAGDPETVRAYGLFCAEMGAELASVVVSTETEHLKDLPCATVVVGDHEDSLRRLEKAEVHVDLMIANANARQTAERMGVPLYRAGFPIFDRIGAAHQVTAGYRGTRDFIFSLGNAFFDAHDAHAVPAGPGYPGGGHHSVYPAEDTPSFPQHKH
ncbi:MAG: nitrogenase iron-molybdenum cofactor biosynthesis protein NifN [Rhodospirillaceae bacterium]